MKLLFDARVLKHKHYTGVENYAKHILEQLKDKIDITVASPTSTNKYISHLWTHTSLTCKEGTVLFCPANIAPLWVSKRKKLVVTIHDVAFKRFSQSFSRFFRWYYTFIVPINIRRANKIITVSQSSKEDIEKYYPNAIGKIEVVYLGVDAMFKPLHVKKKKQILYVGSMNERKNFVGVLQAFEKLNRKDISLLMVGNFSSSFMYNEASAAVLKKAQNNSLIEFKKNIDNEALVKIYNESLLFLFPSFYEGFGLPVLEAMACGIPVITSNNSSLVEVGGNAVVYCNAGDVDDITAKVKMLLSDEALQSRLIAKGLKRAKKFTWEKAASEHINIFDSILDYDIRNLKKAY